MEKSHLIHIIKQLTPTERRAFSKFLDSPYFNRRADLPKLYAWILKALDSKKRDLSKDKAYGHLFPKEPYDDTNCRLLMSYLTKLAEQFLVIESIQQKPFFQKKELMLSFRKKGMHKAYLKTRRLLQETHEKETLRHADYFENEYELMLEAFHDEAVQQKWEEFPLQRFADQLDLSYIIKKLRQACLLLNQKSIIKTEVEIGLLPQIMEYVRKIDLEAVPTVGMYFYAYMSMTDQQEESHFQKLKSLLLAHYEKFPPEELQELHLMAINYSIRQVNGGKQEYFQPMLELYKEGLRTQTLLQSGHLSRFTYHNIVAAAIKTKEFDWAEGFVSEFRPLLHEEYRESAHSFNISKLAYSKGDFDTALRELQNANYRDVLLNLAAKTLALKIYFETDEIDLLQSHLEAMRTYIRRKKVIGYHRTNYLNIVQQTQRMVQLNFFDRQAKVDFWEEVEGIEPLTEKAWFRERLG